MSRMNMKRCTKPVILILLLALGGIIYLNSKHVHEGLGKEKVSEGVYNNTTPIDCGYDPLKPQIVKGAKKILVIGDSISVGYTFALKGYLPQYSIYHNYCNAAHTRNGLEKIGRWLAVQSHWDMVVFNFGIWDANLYYKISVAEYAANLKAIAKKIKGKADHVVFFTTTDIPLNSPSPLYHAEYSYNDAAMKVMRELGIKVYDLHSVSETIQNLHLNPDKQNDVHYLPEGYQVLAGFVSKSIIYEFNPTMSITSH